MTRLLASLLAVTFLLLLAPGDASGPGGLAMLTAIAAAFSIARFKWHRVVLIIIAVGAMVPVQVALAPMFTLMSSLGLLNSDLGIILPDLAFGIPYQISSSTASSDPSRWSWTGSADRRRQEFQIVFQRHPPGLQAGTRRVVHPGFRRHLE